VSVAVELLPPGQRARRTRVMESALVLAAEGGYDAVQMRDVAAGAQVALGTIYRYFASKDHLLAECLLENWRETERRLDRRPLVGTTAVERVSDLVHRFMRGIERSPALAAALVTASSSPDPAVRDCQIEQTAIEDSLLVRAMGGPAVDGAAARARTLRWVWFATLLGWVNGWHDLAFVQHEFDAAVRFVLADLS